MSQQQCIQRQSINKSLAPFTGASAMQLNDPAGTRQGLSYIFIFVCVRARVCGYVSNFSIFLSYFTLGNEN